MRRLTGVHLKSKKNRREREKKKKKKKNKEKKEKENYPGWYCSLRYPCFLLSFVYESSSYFVIRGEARGGGDGVLFYTHLYLAGSERLINRF